MRALTIILSLVVLALLAACQAAPGPVTFTEDDAAAVRSLMQETYAQAMLEGDLETATSIWADDALRVPPHGANLVGSDAIRAAYEAMPYEVTALEWTDVDMQGSGDLAFMRGDYSFAAESGDAAFAETGTSFVLFRREGSEWKVAANMWRPDPAVTDGSDVDAIRALKETRMAAARAGDLDAVMETMTEDVVMMPPGSPSVSGEAAIREYIGSVLNTFDIDVMEPYSSITVVGDWAFEDYSYEATLTAKAGGSPFVDAGRGMYVYRRGADGKWRVARDVWNYIEP